MSTEFSIKANVTIHDETESNLGVDGLIVIDVSNGKANVYGANGTLTFANIVRILQNYPDNRNRNVTE